MATNPYLENDDPEERRRGQLQALQPPPVVTDPYKDFQGGVSFPTGPVSTTMPVPDPNKPITLPTTPATTTPTAPSTSALTGHRDQWSAPANVATRGDFGRLTGFDRGKFEGDEQTLKYQAGRQFSGFDPTQGVGQLFSDPEFTKLFPNAKAVGDDKIDWGFGDLPLDAIQDYGTPNAKWAWQPGEGTGAPASAAGGGGVSGGGLGAVPAFDPTGVESNIAAILKEITALANQTKSPMERQALIDFLNQHAVGQGPVVP